MSSPSASLSPSHHRRAQLVPRVALVVAPLLMGSAMLLDLTPGTDGTSELLGAVAKEPGRWVTTGTLFLLSGLAWTLAGVGLTRMTGRRSRLAGAAGLALAAGGTALALIDAAGVYLPHLARSGAPLQEQVGVVEAVEGSAPLIAAELVHVVGWGVGMLLLAVGLLVSRALPRWIPVLLLVSLAGLVAFVQGPPLAAAVAAHVAALTGLAIHLPLHVATSRSTGGNTGRSAPTSRRFAGRTVPSSG